MRKTLTRIVCAFSALLILSATGGAMLAASAEWHWYPSDIGICSTVDGEQYWISLDEDELLEIADLLGEELNLPTAAVAGIIANLQTESSFNEQKVGDLGEAYGLCQWRGPRLEAMVEFCEEQDLNPISREGQLMFLAHDLQEHYIYAYDLLRSCSDTEQGAVQAAFYFCSQYEAPANPDEVSPPRERLTKNLVYPLLKELRET